LGIRVTAPFKLERDGTAYEFDALVHDFGSERGMLLFAEWDDTKARAATACGFGYSCMEPGLYDRAVAIEVMRDWGWARDVHSRPPWYDDDR